MLEYGDVAVGATDLARAGGIQPPEAWEEATRTVFPHSVSLQDKGCPRGAYLGLCEDGLVLGIPSGTYTRSRDNKGMPSARSNFWLPTRPSQTPDPKCYGSG